MDGPYYCIFRSNGHDGYYLDYTKSDACDEELVKSYDVMLHRALRQIFRESCLTSGQIKELLRFSEPTDQDIVIKLIVVLEPALRGIFPDGSKLSLLWIAVLFCYQDSAELLVRSGADVNERCGINMDRFFDEKWTILHRLLVTQPSSWNERFIGLVTDHGADLEARDSHGCTPLHCAVRKGRVEVAKLLLEKGADANAVANDGKTPLATAVNSSNAEELMLLLLEHGAGVTVRDLKARDSIGWTLLHFAAQIGTVKLAKMALEKGADVDAADIDGITPLLTAALYGEGNTDLVTLLLEHGANLNARAEDDTFPLYHAAGCNKPAMVLTLVERGANIDLKTSNGSTALHIACRNLNVDIIKILYFLGADMSVENHAGNTPFSQIYTSDHSNSSVQLMLRLLALTKTRQQPSIESKDERRIRKDPERWNYYRDCIQEIDRMKSTRFTEACSFFELMTKCRCQIAALMRNREFESKFKQQDVNAFSKYANDLLEAFDAGKRYCSRIQESEDLIVEAFYNIWPHIIVRKVVLYMHDCTECEIKKIVNASRGSNDNSEDNSNAPREQ